MAPISSAATPLHVDTRADQRDSLICVTVAAQMLGIKRTQVWRLATAGEIPSILLGTAKRGCHYFRQADLEAYRERRDTARAARAAQKSHRTRRKSSLREQHMLIDMIAAGEITLADLPSIRRRVAGAPTASGK